MDDAGFLFTLPYIVSGLLAVPLGSFVSRYGYRKIISITGMVLMALGHAINIYLPDCHENCNEQWVSLIPLILLGLAYGTYAAVLWGSVPLLVNQNVQGTAFGICTVLQNFGTVITPPIIGWIEEETKYIDGHGYTCVEIFFVCVSLLAVILLLV
jgi:MFS family permease